MLNYLLAPYTTHQAFSIFRTLSTKLSGYTKIEREKGGSIRSCDALLKRVEDNDPKLTELVILPMKTFGLADMERLSNAIGKHSMIM